MSSISEGISNLVHIVEVLIWSRSVRLPSIADVSVPVGLFFNTGCLSRSMQKGGLCERGDPAVVSDSILKNTCTVERFDTPCLGYFWKLLPFAFCSVFIVYADFKFKAGSDCDLILYCIRLLDISSLSIMV